MVGSKSIVVVFSQQQQEKRRQRQSNVDDVALVSGDVGLKITGMVFISGGVFWAFIRDVDAFLS